MRQGISVAAMINLTLNGKAARYRRFRKRTQILPPFEKIATSA